jgi:hypothetical protein
VLGRPVLLLLLLLLLLHCWVQKHQQPARPPRLRC